MSKWVGGRGASFLQICILGITIIKSQNFKHAVKSKIGYDKAAYIAKTAHKNGTTLKQEVIKVKSGDKYNQLIKERDF